MLSHSPSSIRIQQQSG